MTQKLLGITVMPEFYQTEGIDAVLDNIMHRAGATAVTTSPYVMAEADAATGSREPPDDAGAGAVRLLDRPLWGKRELFVRTAPSFEPDLSLYKDLRYQPTPPNELTREQGHLVGDFIRSAQARHLKVYLQVQSAIPPGYRVQFGGPTDDDQPRLPDGSIPKRRLAKNGSLASPHIRDYLSALLRDLVRVYPDVDGFRIDWPEYPPYFLDDAHLDFSPHVRGFLKRIGPQRAAGYDFDALQQEAATAYRAMHGELTDKDLREYLDLLAELKREENAIVCGPGIGLEESHDLNALIVQDFLAQVRRLLNEISPAGRRYELVPNAFAAPFTALSGYDFGLNTPYCDATSVKLYTMHWPMIVNFWAKELLAANPKLSEPVVVEWLVTLFDVGPDKWNKLPYDLKTYTYPEPNVPHPTGLDALRRKIRQAKEASKSKMPIYALAHGYGPVDDFRRRLAAAWETADGVWINRYAYLSDAKLDAVGKVCRSG